jgi:hypothetical protein
MEARWWAMRPAQSHKPASYVCPFCDGMLHATSPHALIAPEGDVSKRRHAHMDCVVAARKRGQLTTEDEWRARERSGRPEKAKRPPGGGRFGLARKRGRR